MKRREAREIAVKSLYHMDMNQVSVEEAIRAGLDDGEDEPPGEIKDSQALAHIASMVEGTYARKTSIDRVLADYLTGWTLERLSKVDRQVLRLAMYEMFTAEAAPVKVIINEAIELAKHFGTEESGKFVNGVLGKVAREYDMIKLKLREGNEADDSTNH